MISVTINLTRLDYFIGQCRMNPRHPVNVGAWLLFGGWMAFGTLNGHAYKIGVVLLAIIVAYLLCALILFGVVVLVVIAMTLLARRERGVLGEHSYRFTEAGLVESTSVNENLIKWGGIRALMRTRRYVYVRVTFAQYYTIPRRYFADAAADDEFWKSLQPLVAKKDS